jgi:hypothetical protein
MLIRILWIYIVTVFASRGENFYKWSIGQFKDCHSRRKRPLPWRCRDLPPSVAFFMQDINTFTCLATCFIIIDTNNYFCHKYAATT